MNVVQLMDMFFKLDSRDSATTLFELALKMLTDDQRKELAEQIKKNFEWCEF